MQTLRVITLGCSKNTVDTEHLLYQVKGSYEIVPEDDPRAVDVEAINTCGFIGDAKEQSVQVILEEARKKDAEASRKLREATGLLERLQFAVGPAGDLEEKLRALLEETE